MKRPTKVRRLWRFGTSDESSVRDYVWGAAILALGLLVGIGIVYMAGS